MLQELSHSGNVRAKEGEVPLLRLIAALLFLECVGQIPEI